MMRQFDAFIPLTAQHDEWQHKVVVLSFGPCSAKGGSAGDDLSNFQEWPFGRTPPLRGLPAYLPYPR